MGVIWSPSCCPRLGLPPTCWLPVQHPPGSAPFAGTCAQKARLGLRPIEDAAFPAASFPQEEEDGPPIASPGGHVTEASRHHPMALW